MTRVLRASRTEFNARFVEMKRRHPDLDGARFTEILRTMVAPIVEAVEVQGPDQLSSVAWAAYEAALVVAAERLAGPGGRYPVIAEAWCTLLPQLAHLLVREPLRVIGAITNAVTLLASTPGVRAHEWTSALVPIAPKLNTVDQLLRAGQLAAWRCGMAHFREGALAAAEGLPAELALPLVGAAAGKDWEAVAARLRQDRWWAPGESGATEPLRLARKAGAFRGFGGLFIEPPVVAASGNQIFVRSGQTHWLLTADRFGATFHRADASEYEQALRLNAAPSTKGASVSFHGQQRKLEAFGALTSAAATKDTLAVTGTLTHSIALLAIA